MGISLLPTSTTPVLKAPTAPTATMPTAQPAAPTSSPSIPGLPKFAQSFINTTKAVNTANPAQPAVPTSLANYLNSTAPSVAKAAGVASPTTPSDTTPSTGATPPVLPPPPPPPGTAAAAPAPGADANAANGGQYTPGSVAIGSTVLPNADPRLTGTQSAVDAASSGLANVDRTKLAQDMFSTFAQSTNPAYEASIRDATRAAAGAGRIGSGDLRTSYGNLANQRNQQLQTAQQSFMQDALEGSIGDQFNKVNALSGLEGQQYGEGTDTNNQLRTERGYQTDLGQQAFTDALNQWKQQQADQGQAFGQSAATAQLITSMKQAGIDPSIIASFSQSLASKPVSGSAPTPTGTIVNNPTNVG